MRKPSQTYRFFVAFLAVIVLACTSLSTGLVANAMLHKADRSISIENAESFSMMSMSNCDSNTAQNQPLQSCNQTTSECGVCNATVETVAKPDVQKVSCLVHLAVGSISAFQPTKSIHNSADLPPTLSHSPPIFLVNCTFLN